MTLPFQFASCPPLGAIPAGLTSITSNPPVRSAGNLSRESASSSHRPLEGKADAVILTAPGAVQGAEACIASSDQRTASDERRPRSTACGRGGVTDRRDGQQASFRPRRSYTGNCIERNRRWETSARGETVRAPSCGSNAEAERREVEAQRLGVTGGERPAIHFHLCSITFRAPCADPVRKHAEVISG